MLLALKGQFYLYRQIFKNIFTDIKRSKYTRFIK